MIAQYLIHEYDETREGELGLSTPKTVVSFEDLVKRIEEQNVQ